MTQRVAVVTDSAASVPDPLRGLYELAIVPLTIVVGDRVALEGEGITPEEVASALDSRVKVSTAQPGTESFASAIEEAASSGADAVLLVTLSRQLSGTFDSAMAAARAARVPVEVVDTGTVAMAEGFAAVAAAAAAARGGELRTCARVARQVAAGSACVFTVDSLEPLRRGGRLSAAAAAVGTALSLRPLLAVRDGEIVVDSRERTTSRARAALVAHAANRVAGQEPDGTVPVAAVLGLQPEPVAQVRSLLAAALPGVPVVTGPISATLAAHVGSGAVAVVTARMPDSVAEELRAL